MLLRAACDACHRMKRKCDGKNPCTRCDRRGRECFYSCKQKSGPPKGSKRKLVEAEDDLPENRCIKPSLGDFCWPGTNGKSGSDEMQSPTEALASQSSLAVGPSPEARAAAAAAVAASRLNALSPAVPPALAAAGLRSSYMLRSPPILPGLSGGTVPTATPLVTHPRYGTVYQHQYPPEVYAVYLAELRQRSCNIILNSSNSTTTSNGSINENTIHEDGTTSDATAMTTISNASDSCQQEGVDKFEGSPSTRATLLGRLEDGRPPSDAEAASISAVGFENGITSAREFMAQYSGRAELATTGSELLSEAVHFVEHLAGVGASDREIAASGDMLLDRNAFPYVARISEGDNGVGEPAKEAAVSAAASAALAAAVAAAIAEACPGGEDEAEEEYPSKSNVLSKVGRSSTENGWFGVDLAASISPVKGSRFDALPETGLAMVPKYQTAESTMTTPAKKWSDGETSSASSNCEGTTQRERQAAAALLLHGANNRTAMLATANFSDVSGRERMPETCDEHERVKQEKTEDFSQRDDPKAATKASCKYLPKGTKFNIFPL